MIPVENQIYTTNFFGSGNPNLKPFIAKVGVEYTDSDSLIRYRQLTNPTGKKWVAIALNVTIETVSEADETLAWLAL